MLFDAHAKLSCDGTTSKEVPGLREWVIEQAEHGQRQVQQNGENTVFGPLAAKMAKDPMFAMLCMAPAAVPVVPALPLFLLLFASFCFE